MQHQFEFKSKEQFLNFRRRWSVEYEIISVFIKNLKAISRDLSISEMERQFAGRQLNSKRQLARTLMMGLDAAKMFYQLTHQTKPPIVYKQRPSDEEIETRRAAKRAKMN